MAKKRRSNKPYNFSAKRRAQLKKAAYISARKRERRKKNITRVGVGVLAATGIGVAGYLGVKHSAQIQATTDSARKAVQPLRKEAVRKMNALGGNLIARGPKPNPTPAKPGGKRPAIKRATKVLVPQEDPQKVRDRDTPYREPGYHQRFDENDPDFAIIDRTDKYLPKELVKGRKIKDTTIRKALDKDAKARGNSGMQSGDSRSSTLAGQNEIVNEMIADGTVRRTVAGRKIARGMDAKTAQSQARKQAEARRKKKAGAKKARNSPSGMTDEQLKAAFGFEDNWQERDRAEKAYKGNGEDAF